MFNRTVTFYTTQAGKQGRLLCLLLARLFLLKQFQVMPNHTDD
jgi:hypothetical protein